MQRYYHPFDPILFNDTKILILGTFPSLDSFKVDFYYGHKRNQFWKLLSTIYQMPIESRAQKIELVKQNRLGLYDVVRSCKRRNSSDSNLKECELFDFPALLEAYPSIEKLAFTGVKARQLFEQVYADLEVARVTLPSPSPAYASMRFEQKLEIYREALIDIA